MARSTRVNRQKTKRKTRSRRGGGVIGSGSYGCVYKPALRCPGNAAVNRSQQISKLIKQTNVPEEIEGVDILKTIDPVQNYLLYPLDEICPFNITAQPDPVSIQATFLAPTEMYNIMPKPMKKMKCPIHGINKNSTVLFNYDGGVNPTENSYSANDYYYVFEGFAKIFDAVNLLHTNNVVHHDIKDLNMVLKVNATGDGYDYKLIDFGFMRTLGQFRARFSDGPNINNRYVHPYIIWPFYSFIFNYKRSDLLDLLSTKDIRKRTEFDQSLLRKFERWEQNIKSRVGQIPEGLFYKHNGRPDSKVSVLLSIENIKANIYEIIKTEENYINFAKNMDIFSLGYSLIILFSHMFGIYSYLDRKVIGATKIYILFNNKDLKLFDTYRWGDKKLEAWVDHFIMNVLQPFYSLISKMYRHDNLWISDDFKAEYMAFLSVLHDSIYIPGTNEKRREFVKYIQHVKPVGFSSQNSTPFVPTPIAPPLSTGMSLAVPLAPPAPQPVRQISVTGRGVKRQATPIGPDPKTGRLNPSAVGAVVGPLESNSVSSNSSTSIKAASQATTPSNRGFFPGNL